MKIRFKSIAMTCGLTAVVFCFFHPIVASVMTAACLYHRRVMRKGREVPKMLPLPLKPAENTGGKDQFFNPATGELMVGPFDMKGNLYGLSFSNNSSFDD